MKIATAQRQSSSRQKPVNLGRHEFSCKICSHSRREEIERDFISWKSPAAIVKQYSLSDRSSVYRHAHALGLFPKRSRNVRAALERIIERADDVSVNASSVVQAVAVYARINSEGKLVDRSERVDLNELFHRMSREELDSYAKEGKLPEWFYKDSGAQQPRTVRTGIRMANSLRKQDRHSTVPATVSGPGPGDYPLGSLQSRAAGRGRHDRVTRTFERPSRMTFTEEEMRNGIRRMTDEELATELAPALGKTIAERAADDRRETLRPRSTA